jgi:hypothetical protein
MSHDVRLSATPTHTTLNTYTDVGRFEEKMSAPKTYLSVFTVTWKQEYLSRRPIETYTEWVRAGMYDLFHCHMSSRIVSGDTCEITATLSRRDFEVAISYLEGQFISQMAAKMGACQDTSKRQR